MRNIHTFRSDPERTQRVQQLRRSNAAGLHEDRRTRRMRTRAATRRAAINDQA